MKKLTMEAAGTSVSIPVPDNFAKDSRVRKQVAEDHPELALFMSLFSPPSRVETTISDITNEPDKTSDLK